MVSLHNVDFYEPGKNKKWTRTFDTKFREHDQSVTINAQRLFLFYGSTKKSMSVCYDNLIMLLKPSIKGPSLVPILSRLVKIDIV